MHRLTFFHWFAQDGSTMGHIRNGNVQLSTRHSVALTDVTVLSQDPGVAVRFKGEDKMEHLRVISIQDVAGTSLLFLANNFREAELLVCGLKLLLERETVRLGVRGGLPFSAFGGRSLEGAMSPSAARGYRAIPSSSSSRRKDSKSVSSHMSSDLSAHDSPKGSIEKNVPDSRRTWGDVPGRNYMRGQAATLMQSLANGYNEQGVPQYMFGQQVVRDVARNIRLPLPLPLCRVLLLDSTSPVIRKWENDRGDSRFEKTRWSFPPASSRERDRYPSEHQLIASGSMCGAIRTISFERSRYGSIVHLSETHTVDSDDSKKVVFTVEERNPRRGFQVIVRVLLKAYKENSCDASVIAELRPVGKDMSNQAAVHKAFMLVLDEIKLRYGTEGSGLLAGFMKVVDNMVVGSKGSPAVMADHLPRMFHRTGPVNEEKKTDGGSAAAKKDSRSAKSGLVSFEDMLKSGRQSPETTNFDRPSTPSITHQVLEPNPAKRLSKRSTKLLEAPASLAGAEEEPRLIEVKPLPKIRLSLMPSPREEDEDEMSSSSPAENKHSVKKKKKSSLRARRLSRSPEAAR